MFTQHTLCRMQKNNANLLAQTLSKIVGEIDPKSKEWTRNTWRRNCVT